ncbi:uncharacterized protein LOC143249270 [Tachypleus tridentatus]|uniref:uncharacterized protein LOC143249270 n=1 Tax=Tachypleus tridentatus TaxID=6853 RepID=UPI003FD3AE84
MKDLKQINNYCFCHKNLVIHNTEKTQSMGTRDRDEKPKYLETNLKSMLHWTGSTPKSRYNCAAFSYSTENQCSDDNHNILPSISKNLDVVSSTKNTPAKFEAVGKQLPLTKKAMNENSADAPFNPFYIEPDTLHLPAFSPSVFATVKGNKSEETKPFRWSIDQLAVLKPADIDETSQQDTYCVEDELVEVRAQQAIEKFFSQKHIVPSPWTAPTKHVTFSPNLASTAYYTKLDESLNSSEQCVEQLKISKKEVWSQTVLTIPPAVDLFGLLEWFSTFKEEQSQQNSNCSAGNDSEDIRDSGSSSSLRRKLFFQPENEYPPSPARINKTGFPSTSSKICHTPRRQDLSNAHTPGTQFSSSPITPRNCSISFSASGCSLSPPSISPIRKSIFHTPYTVSRSGVSSSSSKSSSLESNIPSIFITSTARNQNNESKIEVRTENKHSNFKLVLSNPTCDYGAILGVTNGVDTSIGNTSVSGKSSLKPPCELADNENTCSMESLTEENLETNEAGPGEFSQVCTSSSLHVRSLTLNTNSELLQDTGYQTGSFQHASSLSGQEIAKNQIRITSAAEVVDSCVISGLLHSPKLNKCKAPATFISSDTLCKASSNGSKECHAATFSQNSSLFDTISSHDDLEKNCKAHLLLASSHHVSHCPNFGTVSAHSLWKPSVFSTPTKKHLV